MPSPALSPADAVRIAQRARRLVRSGRLSHTAYVVLDNLLWSCRPKNASHAVVSYNGLARLAHLAKATITRAIVTLEALRLITKVRRRALFPWACGGQQARNLANKYILLVPTAHEFTRQPIIQSESIYLSVPAVSQYSIEAAKAALASRRRDIESRLAMK